MSYQADQIQDIIRHMDNKEIEWPHSCDCCGEPFVKGYQLDGFKFSSECVFFSNHILYLSNVCGLDDEQTNIALSTIKTL